MSYNNFSSNTHFDVLILGAGISGISAAHFLIEKYQQLDNTRQFRIAVIEAQDRYGGRIHTKQFGQGYVELGANWCHGAHQANSIFNLACKFDLIELPLNLFDRGVGAFLHSSGNAIDQELAIKLYEELKIIEYSTVHLDPSEKRTLEQYIDDKVTELKVKYPEKHHSLIDSAVTYAKLYIQLHGGDSCLKQSAWGLGAYNEIPGDVTIKGGYKSLLDRMVREIGQEKLRLGEEVLQIDWSQPKIAVSTSKGSYTCNYVLVTFSLGVLKRSHTALFSPTLPQDKVSVIESMGFGRLSKIYLQYEKPFWQPGTLNCLKFYPDPDDQKRISERSYSPNEFINYINGFEEIPSSADVLLAWVTGEHTTRLDQCSEQYIGQQCTELLRLYTGDQSLPSPSKVLLSDWNCNRFIEGSYSYPSTRTVDRFDFDLIAKSLFVHKQEKVFFSGEATHPFYYSAVHGARQTGINAADKIFKLWLQHN